METKVEVALAVHNEKICSIESKVDQLVEAIIGNGHPGLKTRIDRLERSERLKNKVLWLLFATVVTVVGALVTDRLTTEHAPAAVRQEK